MVNAGDGDLADRYINMYLGTDYNLKVNHIMISLVIMKEEMSPHSLRDG